MANLFFIPCLLFLLINSSNQNTYRKKSMPTYSPCFTTGISWAEADISDVIVHVWGPEECQTHCQNPDQGVTCLGWTWTTENFEVFPQSCALFSSLDNKVACHECVSGPPQCLCSDEGQCEVVEENLLGVIPNVVEEITCQQACNETDQCAFYSWFSDTSPLFHLCMLFSSCDLRDTNCNGCFTGPAECSESSTSTMSTAVSSSASPQTTNIPTESSSTMSSSSLSSMLPSTSGTTTNNIASITSSSSSQETTETTKIQTDFTSSTTSSMTSETSSSTTQFTTTGGADCDWLCGGVVYGGFATTGCCVTEYCECYGHYGVSNHCSGGQVFCDYGCVEEEECGQDWCCYFQQI